MNKEVIIKFDKDAFQEFEKLKTWVSQGKKTKKKPGYDQLLNSINNTVSKIKLNPFFGDLVPRKYIPKKTIKEYGTDKIFRAELIGYWRLIYTVIGEEAKIIAFILEFMDHKKYNKIFAYKNK